MRKIWQRGARCSGVTLAVDGERFSSALRWLRVVPGYPVDDESFIEHFDVERAILHLQVVSQKLDSLVGVCTGRQRAIFEQELREGPEDQRR